MNSIFIVLVTLVLVSVSGFGFGSSRMGVKSQSQKQSSSTLSFSSHSGLGNRGRTCELQMNFFEDASRFFSNMNKEASAKHILMKGSDARTKLNTLKNELAEAEDLSAAFSDLAAKVSECPSANRGGNLGTFKPGMMVKEFDKIVFEEEVGKVRSLWKDVL